MASHETGFFVMCAKLMLQATKRGAKKNDETCKQQNGEQKKMTKRASNKTGSKKNDEMAGRGHR
jgi:hypothetical protein